MEDKTDDIAKNWKYDGYQRALASIIYKSFGKEAGSGVSVNENLAKEYISQ